MKLTEWYSGNQKPVRVGVYARKHDMDKDDSIYYSFWDGSGWRGGSWLNPERCMQFKEKFPDDAQCVHWRGIAK